MRSDIDRTNEGLRGKIADDVNGLESNGNRIASFETADWLSKDIR
jgi:hypothetical protein